MFQISNRGCALIGLAVVSDHELGGFPGFCGHLSMTADGLSVILCSLRLFQSSMNATLSRGATLLNPVESDAAGEKCRLPSIRTVRAGAH